MKRRTFDYEDERRGGSRPRRRDERTRPPKRREAAELYSDDAIVVLNKPAETGQAFALDDDDDDASTAEENAAGLGAMAVYAVEADVSGAVLLARDAESAAALRSSGDVQVRCLAIVRGHVTAENGVFEKPVIERAIGNPILKIDEAKGRPAKTEWRLVDRFIAFALLECSTTPVNLHQVRAHLANVALPLAVDRAYGGGTELRLSTFKAGYRPSGKHEERPLISRVSLHVAGVKFRHPKSGAEMSFEAPPPKDFRAAVHQLERFGRLPK